MKENKYTIIRYILSFFCIVLAVYNINDMIIPNKYFSYFYDEYNKNSKIGRYSFTIKEIESESITKYYTENLEYFLVSNDDYYIALEVNKNSSIKDNLKVGETITVDVLPKYTDNYYNGTRLNFTNYDQAAIANYYLTVKESKNTDKYMKITRVLSTRNFGKFDFWASCYAIIFVVIGIVIFPKKKLKKKLKKKVKKESI